MKYTGEFYNEGADKTNKKPIEVKEEIMKKALSLLLASVMLLTCLAACGNSSTPSGNSDTPPATAQTGGAPETGSGEPAALEGEITFWHSFTQGPRLETIQAGPFL